MTGTITLTRSSGESLGAHLDELARLRIRVFREYPYLYEGDLDYERRYLDTYRRSSGSVVVLARDGERIVGASSAIPMAHESDETKAPFVRAGLEVERIFYLGESVLLPEYRGRGIGVAFFEQREAHAREAGARATAGSEPARPIADTSPADTRPDAGPDADPDTDRPANLFSTYCFCAVQRPADHPARPAGYRPLDGFWRRRGYERRPDLTTRYAWKELGEEHESPKPMVFWTKAPRTRRR